MGMYLTLPNEEIAVLLPAKFSSNRVPFSDSHSERTERPPTPPPRFS